MSDTHDDTIDIEPRSVDAIARRATLLVALLRRAAMELPGESPDESDGFMRETDRFELYSWTRREAGDDMTAEERSLLRTPAGHLGEGDTNACLVASNPARALAWSLGVLDTLAPTDTPNSHVAMLTDWAPAPWDEVARWARKLVVRPEEELARERERWEVWQWRATLMPDDVDPGETLETVTAEVARDAADAGLAQMIEDDLAIDSRPVRALSADEMDSLAALAENYLLALNWVCGFGAAWSSTPLYPD